jgi:hypothetical protein
MDGTSVAASAQPSAVEIPSASPLIGAVLLAVWIGSGLLTAAVMGRRGHDAPPLYALGLAFGPLLIPLARDYAREFRNREVSYVVSPGAAGRGRVDVLIGLSGRGDSVCDAAPLLDQLGPRLGRVAIAVAVDFESAARDEWNDAKADAALELEVATALLSRGDEPRTVIVGGPPTESFRRHARSAAYDLLVLTTDQTLDGTGERDAVVVVAFMEFVHRRS